MHTCARAVIACLLMPGAAALGQLVTQPPAHVPRPEERIAKVGAEVWGGGCLPRDEIARHFGHRPQLDAIQFKSLVQRDANGNVLPLSEPIEWAALRNNPLVSQEDMARIEPSLLKRRPIIDRIVIDNLDLAERIDDGLFEKIDLSDNKAFTTLLDVAKPLRSDDMLPMSQSTSMIGLLSPDQRTINDRIANDYKRALLPEEPPGANPAQKGLHARRSLALLYKQSLDEPLFELRRMRLAAARSLSKTVPSLGLDRATAKAVTEIAAQARPEDDQAALAVTKQVNERLTLEQRKQLLRAASDQWSLSIEHPDGS